MGIKNSLNRKIIALLFYFEVLSSLINLVRYEVNVDKNNQGQINVRFQIN